jgi:hypothetical protein
VLQKEGMEKRPEYAVPEWQQKTSWKNIFEWKTQGRRENQANLTWNCLGYEEHNV